MLSFLRIEFFTQLVVSVRQPKIAAVILLSTVIIFHLMPTSFKGKDAVTGKFKYQWVSVKGTKKDTKKRLSELLNQLAKGLSLNLVRLPRQKIWRGGF